MYIETFVALIVREMVQKRCYIIVDEIHRRNLLPLFSNVGQIFLLSFKIYSLVFSMFKDYVGESFRCTFSKKKKKKFPLYMQRFRSYR